MNIIIFGGAGYIGTHLAKHFLNEGQGHSIVIADIQPSSLKGQPGVVALEVDVRQPIPQGICPDGAPDWIFNLAAVHREPGHEAHEYFDTNIAGAENVCAYAEAVGCCNIYFTSSISVYGPTNGPTTEAAPLCPISPYGGSKFPAELIHRAWQSRAPEQRRLIVVRPGVVYGPNDPGNIGRMVNAIKKGYFAFPGSMRVKKSYAYIYGMLESIRFTMARPEPVITYNYVETPTEDLGTIAGMVKQQLGTKAPLLSLPTALLLPIAHLVQALAGKRNPVHPVRVRKAGLSTHIVPQTLISMGFAFKFPFAQSLVHWRQANPQDFE
jgi:nucleoside-diphosphate-sugar epimerase